MQNHFIPISCSRSRLWGSGVLILITVSSWCFWKTLPRPRSIGDIGEACTREELRLDHEKWYRKNSPEPFTGFLVQRGPHQELLAKSRLESGMLEGVSEGWYPNGQLQIREHFHQGVSNGLREKWYENGQKQSESQIHQGLMEATFRKWHPNGQLAETIPMQHGQPNGVALTYFPSGFLESRAHVADGQVLQRESWQEHEHQVDESEPPETPGTLTAQSQ